MEPLESHTFVKGDIRHDATLQRVLELLDGRRAQVVLSDMAPKMTGNRHDDHVASVELCREALKFAEAVLQERPEDPA